MIYAQYRMGNTLLEDMPPEVRRTISRFRQLYDMGLHGPGLLEFCGQGEKFLLQTGDVFFDRVCRAVRMDRSQAAMAYLYGLVAYYALVSACQTTVNQTSKALSMPPQHIQTEFDRFLLELDGHAPAYRYDRSRHLRLTPGECRTVAMFYPGVRAAAVGRGVKRMVGVLSMPVLPIGSRRDFVIRLLRLRKQGEYVMGAHPDHRLRHTNEELLRCYRRATETYPMLLAQIQIRLRKKAPLSQDFGLSMGIQGGL